MTRKTAPEVTPETVGDIPDTAPVVTIGAMVQGVFAEIHKTVQEEPEVERLRLLIPLWHRARTDLARSHMAAAMSAFQSECGTIAKSAKVSAGANRSYKFAPFDEIVETIRPLLVKYGLSYSFRGEPTAAREKGFTVTCCIYHVGGHHVCSSMTVPVASNDFMNAAQHMGSALTYARRYTLCAALGLAVGDEDDDAQAASQRPSRQASPAATAGSVIASGGQSERIKTLQADIYSKASELGYDAAKVRKWINQKYEVTVGLDGLKEGELKEVLKIFREQAEKLGKSREASSSGISGSSVKETAGGDVEKPLPSKKPTTTADDEPELEPAETPEQALSKGALTTIRSVMGKAGLAEEDFHDRFGFGSAALRASDVKTVHAWIKSKEAGKK